MKILNGHTKDDSLGRATFHGVNGISVIDYIICDQELLENINYFVVKPQTYLSNHSQIITWLGVGQPNDETNINPCDGEMT